MHNYDNLSGYALTCLLYLGIFPNSHPLKRKVLIRRWLAEGYARSNTLQSEQDISDENFSKLINRSIIKPIDTGNNAKVKKCRAHGIMHEFVLHKSMSQKFIATSSYDHSSSNASSTVARHLSILGGDLKDGGAPDEDLLRVRSLTVFGKLGDAINFIPRCKLLRVLDLEECDDLEDEHLNNIHKLWHLKYLSLGGTIRKLPSSIERLHCLETLDARRTNINIFPIEVLKLPHLTHLFGKFMIDTDDLNNAKKMSEAQKFLSKKSNLKTLAGFVTRESQGFLQLMGRMKNLTKVKIWCEPVANDSTYTTDLSHAIQEYSKVPIDWANTLSLSLDLQECSEDLLSSLNFSPCPEGYKYGLRSLKLRGKLLQLPSFKPLLSGLSELCISSANLTKDFPSSLINLDSLLYLKLITHQTEGFQIKTGAFPSLKRLHYEVQSLNPSMATNEHAPLPTITIEQGALPRLICLQLLCRGLVDLSGIDIRHLKHLKGITVDSGVTDRTRQDWAGAVVNHPNRPRLFFHKTVYPMESDGLGDENCAVRDKRKRPVDQTSLDCSNKKMKSAEPSSSSGVQSTFQTVLRDNLQEGYMSASPAAPASSSMMVVTPGQMDTIISTNPPQETTLN